KDLRANKIMEPNRLFKHSLRATEWHNGGFRNWDGYGIGEMLVWWLASGVRLVGQAEQLVGIGLAEQGVDGGLVACRGGCDLVGGFRRQCVKGRQRRRTDD
ncbi:hypothetical protein Dimus_022653, partial [Dionaea muscipula]